MDDILRINPTRRFADATVYRSTTNFVEVPTTSHADLRTQVRELLAAAGVTLGKVGSHRSRLLAVTVYLPSLDDLAGFNDEWERWIPPGAAPSVA